MSLLFKTERVRTPSNGATGAAIGTGDGEWPLEVRALFGALGKRSDAAARERRAKPRVDFRALANLWIMQKKRPVAAVPVYLRDYVAGAVSFVGQTCFAGAQPVELEVRLGDGSLCRMPCVVKRCRQFREGWFEGVLTVHR
jgi:hypothetical protein